MLFQTIAADLFDIVPPRKIQGRASRLLVAPGSDFVTQAVDHLELDLEGIPGDRHAGYSRRSGSREPWYRRGTEIRNERQLSIVAHDELAVVAERIGIAEVRPEWVGANLVIDNVPFLSMIPSGTLMFFEGGVTLKVDAQNIPCRAAGKAIAKGAGMTDVEAGALLFPKVAKRMRGLVAWVEKPGRVEAGEGVSMRIPEQWIYR